VKVAIGVGSAGGTAPRGGGSTRVTVGRDGFTGVAAGRCASSAVRGASPVPAAGASFPVERARVGRRLLLAEAFTLLATLTPVPPALALLTPGWGIAFAPSPGRLARAADEPFPWVRDDWRFPRTPSGAAEGLRLATPARRARPDFFFFDAAIPRNWDPPYCRLSFRVNRNGLNSRILPPTIRVVKVLSRPLLEGLSGSAFAEPA
jgi:hypothetical protein